MHPKRSELVVENRQSVEVPPRGQVHILHLLERLVLAQNGRVQLVQVVELVPLAWINRSPENEQIVGNALVVLDVHVVVHQEPQFCFFVPRLFPKASFGEVLPWLVHFQVVQHEFGHVGLV